MKNNNKTVATLQRNDEARKRQTGTKVSSDNIRKEEVARYRKKQLDYSNLIKTNKELLSLSSKSITNDPVKPDNSLEIILNDGKGILLDIHKKIMCTKENNKHTLALFPDLTLGVEIIISSILSPHKMTDNVLTYKFEKDFLLGEESLKSEIIDIVSTYLEDEYNFSDKLPDILKEVTSVSGACPHMVISESVIDDIVNADLLAKLSKESFVVEANHIMDKFSSSRGLINTSHSNVVLNREEPSHENLVRHMVSSSLVKFTDNPSIVSIGNLKRSLQSAIVKNGYRKGKNIAQESMDKLEYLDFFRDRSSSGEDNSVVKIVDRSKASRKAIGKPLNRRIPTESVIPVFTPGDKDDHLGYFILLDEMGVPINTLVNANDIKKMNNTLHGDLTSNNPLAEVYRDLLESSSGKCIDLAGLFEMYKDIMDNQLFEAFSASMYGENVNVANTEAIQFILFCRGLQAQKTSILFIPKENLVYYSMENNDYGVGKTLLDDLLVISSIRAILLFAKVMAYTRQSIDITEVGVRLDDEDQDPEKTFERIKTGVLKLRENMLPIGLTDPQMLTEWIQKTGIKFNLEQHPLLPNVEITYDKGGMQSQIPDSEIDDFLRKQMFMGLGLRPENIDEAYSPNFASSAMFNNALLVKRIAKMQKQFTPEISKHVSMLIYNDMDLRDLIKEMLISRKDELSKLIEEDEKKILNASEEDFFEYYVDKISESIYVDLPQVSDQNVSMAAEEFKTHMEQTEEVIDYLFSDSQFTEDVIGEAGLSLDQFKDALLGLTARRWAADNNYLKDVFDFVSDDEDTNTANTSSIIDHYKNVMKLITTTMTSITDVRNAADLDLKKAKDKVEQAGGETDGGFGGDSSFDSDDEGGDIFGDDGDGGGDSDIFGDDTFKF